MSRHEFSEAEKLLLESAGNLLTYPKGQIIFSAGQRTQVIEWTCIDINGKVEKFLVRTHNK